MVKIKVISCILASILSSSIYAADLGVNQNGVNISTNEEALAGDGLNLSKTLLASTIQLANIATKNNELSQSSMLQLSQDIGTMADRINTMADKIVATQNIQSSNLEMTETNMLAAQKNILGALQSVNNPQAKENLQKATTSLNSAMAQEKANIDIATAKNGDEIISKMAKAPGQYRYKYMNALKVSMYSLNPANRVKAFNAMIAKIETMKSSTQKDMDAKDISSMGGIGSSDIGGMGDTGGMGGMGDAGDAGGDAGGAGGGMGM